MIKIISLLSLLFHFSYGCATCLLMVPSVELDIIVDIEEKKLHTIHFTWNFSQKFTDEMVRQYDKNRNGYLDYDEQNIILQAKLDYLKPKQMLTSIQYADENTSESSALHPTFDNFVLKISNNAMILSYVATLEKNLMHNDSLSISLVDDASFFIFKMRSLDVNKCDFTYSENLYSHIASVLFQDKTLRDEIAKPEVAKDIKMPVTPVEVIKEKEETMQENLLKQTMEKIKSLFESIKDEKNPMTYLVLLVFAFGYGVIHALGPGHGKTLVASYFLSNDRSFSKAFLISLAIGIVHTFSAFILTIVIYYLVTTFLAQFLDDTVYYTTKISAIMVIGIALYLIHKKYRLYQNIEDEKKKPEFTFSTSPVHATTCGCGSCTVDKNSTDAALIISAGIIPCPGTTTLFIFAISTGLYYAGLISALVMSLGMSTVIFISALLSTMVRQKVLTSSDRLKKYLEFGSLALILMLGSMLLFF